MKDSNKVFHRFCHTRP